MLSERMYYSILGCITCADIFRAGKSISFSVCMYTFQKVVLFHSGLSTCFVYFPKHFLFKENCVIFFWSWLWLFDKELHVIFSWGTFGSCTYTFQKDISLPNYGSIGWGSFCSFMYTFWKDVVLPSYGSVLSNIPFLDVLLVLTLYYCKTGVCI